MAKKHKEDLAALVEAQRKVETLGYLDSGETTDKDQGGYEEATDVLGKKRGSCYGDQENCRVMTGEMANCYMNMNFKCDYEAELGSLRW